MTIDKTANTLFPINDDIVLQCSLHDLKSEDQKRSDL